MMYFDGMHVIYTLHTCSYLNKQSCIFLHIFKLLRRFIKVNFIKAIFSVEGNEFHF